MVGLGAEVDFVRVALIGFSAHVVGQRRPRCPDELGGGAVSVGWLLAVPRRITSSKLADNLGRLADGAGAAR